MMALGKTKLLVGSVYFLNTLIQGPNFNFSFRISEETVWGSKHPIKESEASISLAGEFSVIFLGGGGALSMSVEYSLCALFHELLQWPYEVGIIIHLP